MVEQRLAAAGASGGFDHGRAACALALHLAAYARRCGGTAVSGGAGFRLGSDPGVVRAADVAWIAPARARADRGSCGCFPGPPDLAVEVVAPADAFDALLDAVDEWLTGGTRLVMLVSPATRIAAVFRSTTELWLVREHEALHGADVLPGFRIPLAALFDDSAGGRLRAGS